MLSRLNLGRIKIPPFSESEILNKKSRLHRLIAKDNPVKHKKRRKGNRGFTFLVHPRDPFDALECARIGNFPLGSLAKVIPPKLEQEVKNRKLYTSLAKIPPFIIKDSEITIDGYDIKGNLIAVLMYGEQMLLNSWMPYAKKRIIEAIQLAKESGSSIVGLGAHTSPATLGGTTLRSKNNNFQSDFLTGIGITNGNALTAAMTAEAVKIYSRKLGLSPEDTTVGIIGASGSVGAAASRLVNESGCRLILHSRVVGKLFDKFPDLENRAIFTQDLSDMKACDIIIVMTSAVTSTLQPAHVSPGTIIIEDTQPRNIREHDAKKIKKKGSLVIDGGFVHIPGFRCGFNLRLPPETTIACLAETLVLTIEGVDTDFSLGDADVDKAKAVLAMAKKHKFSVASPTWNSKPIKDRDFEIVKKFSRLRHKN